MYVFVFQSTIHGRVVFVFFFFQAEDGIRDLVRSRGLGDVYKRQLVDVVLSDLHLAVSCFCSLGNLALAKTSTSQTTGLSLIHI